MGRATPDERMKLLAQGHEILLRLNTLNREHFGGSFHNNKALVEYGLALELLVAQEAEPGQDTADPSTRCDQITAKARSSLMNSFGIRFI